MSQHKVAIITGSATGVGRASAIRFAKRGFAVTVNYSKSQADAEETCRLVEACGVPSCLVQGSVGDRGAVENLIQTTVQKFGGIDCLVNNAGTTHFIPHTDLDAVTDEIWDEIFQVNLKGAFYACRAAMPYLQEREGSIVNVSSVAGLQGHGSSIPYSASKSAMNCMTQSLARAFAPQVRVNAVAPGPILTRWLVGREEHVDKALVQTPMGRASTPDDVADVIEFLALGTTLMTGQVVVVDGGRTV